MNAWDHPKIMKGMPLQFARKRARIAAGEKAIGWKVGLSAPAMMKTLGTTAPQVSYLMQDVLVSSGCRVLTARNGAQGITLANRHSEEISVLVTDVVMPDVSGPELATHFRQLKPEGRIIFVTGYAPDPSLLQQAVALGAIVLQKPFRVDHFLSEVAHALRAE